MVELRQRKRRSKVKLETGKRRMIGLTEKYSRKRLSADDKRIGGDTQKGKKLSA